MAHTQETKTITNTGWTDLGAGSYLEVSNRSPDVIGLLVVAASAPSNSDTESGHPLLAHSIYQRQDLATNGLRAYLRPLNADQMVIHVEVTT